MTLASLLAGCLQEVSIFATPEVVVDNPPTTLDGDTVTERFPEPASTRSDILWIVDNSCSMLEEQQRIADNASQFIQHFLGSRQLDWHIGFVTTDMYTREGKGLMLRWDDLPYLSKDTQDVERAFRQLILQGNDGPAPERGLDTSWYALTPPLVDNENAGFLRDDALLHIIVISDQQDYSTRITDTAYVEFLRELRGDAAIVSGIVGLPGSGCEGWVEPGAGYIEVIEATGGALVDICEPDWAPVLDDLGAISSQGGAEYFLRRVPALETLEVWIEESNGQTYRFTRDETYTYDAVRNSVKLTGYTPPPGTLTFARYVPLESWIAPGDTGAP